MKTKFLFLGLALATCGMTAAAENQTTFDGVGFKYNDGHFTFTFTTPESSMKREIRVSTDGKYYDETFTRDSAESWVKQNLPVFRRILNAEAAQGRRGGTNIMPGYYRGISCPRSSDLEGVTKLKILNTGVRTGLEETGLENGLVIDNTIACVSCTEDNFCEIDNLETTIDVQNKTGCTALLKAVEKIKQLGELGRSTSAPAKKYV